MTQHQEQLLQETHDTIVELKRAIDGEGGVLHRLKKVEERVEKESNWRIRMIGWAAGAATVASLFGSKIGSFLKDLFTGGPSPHA